MSRCRRGASAAARPAARAWPLLLLAAAAGCAGAWSTPPSADLPFLASAAPGRGPDEVEVLVRVPYRSLVFRREDGGWRAGLLVSVVARRDGERVGGAVAEAAARAATAAEARADRELTCTVPLRLSAAGPAVLEVRARVAGTSRTWVRRLRHPAPPGDAAP